jgi:hypothetical protein
MLKPELKRAIVDGATQIAGERSLEKLAEEENEVLFRAARAGRLTCFFTRTRRI